MSKWLNIAFIMVSGWAFSQATAVDVAVSKTTVTSNEPFTYQISSDCNCSISPPDLSEFDVLDKQQSQFQGTNNMNGVVTKSCTTTLSFILRAKKKGTFKIGKANIKCKSDEADSKEISMTVVDANEAHSANEGVANNYFKLESNKESVFIGEPFVLSFYLYTDVLPEEISAIVPGNAVSLARHPLFDETAPNHVFKRSIRKVKGKEYHVIELKKEVCFADNPGTLHIDAYFGRAVERYGFFDNEYMEGYSNELDIKVKELPGQRPENYKGMAGSFELTHEISKTTLPANQIFEMKVKLEGIGNFHAYRGPEFEFPKDSFLITGPEIVESFENTPEGIKGSIEYTYLITPTKEGDYLILPYSFTYFDWASKKMKAVSTHDFVLHVTEGVETEIWDPKDGGDEPEVETDIRHIHSSSDKFFGKSDFLFGGIGFWMLLTGPMLIAFIVFILKRRKSSRSEENILAGEQKSAKRSALKDIQKIKKEDSAAALHSLKSSLEDYFMTNLGMGRSSLSKQSITDELGKKGVDELSIKGFNDIWSKIEMAQYAPMNQDNVSSLISNTEELIQKLNKQL